MSKTVAFRYKIVQFESEGFRVWPHEARRLYIYLELAMITAVKMWIDDGATQWAKFSISAVT